MFKDHKIRRIREHIRRWGRRNFQSHPWRSDVDGWLTFVAELLLQRTQARQVEQVYLKFRKHYPSPEELLNADPNKVSEFIGTLGLAFRTAILYEIAQAAVSRGGTLPETIDDLVGFKGVGAYTAAAWLSLHRGKRAVLIDSNVARWLSRMTGNPYNRDPRHVTWVKQLADQLTPPRAFRDYNYAVLDFTMKICTPRKPKCRHCPIRTECLYGAVLSTKSTCPDLPTSQTEHSR